MANIIILFNFIHGIFLFDLGKIPHKDKNNNKYQPLIISRFICQLMAG